MLLLKNISLEGYKSIKHCRNLELRPLNVMVGANGSGKSNFLSFFKLLNFAMIGALQEFIGRQGGASSLLYYGPKVTPQFSATLEIESDKRVITYHCRLVHAAPDTLIFGEESLRDRPREITSTPSQTLSKRGHRETALRDPGWKKNWTVGFSGVVLRFFRLYQFHDTSDESRLRGRVDKDDASFLHANGGNLAAILRKLREAVPATYQRIIETIRLAAPFFDDFLLEPDVADSRYIMLRWRAKGRAEYVFGPHQISDGTLRFMTLCTLLMMPPAWRLAMIALDEPELGLHPVALDLLASLLKEASQDTQIIVSTQSPAFIDAFEPEDVIVTELKEDASQFKRLNSTELEDWLKDYSLGDLVRKNVIEAGPVYG